MQHGDQGGVLKVGHPCSSCSTKEVAHAAGKVPMQSGHAGALLHMISCNLSSNFFASRCCSCSLAKFLSSSPSIEACCTSFCVFLPQPLYPDTAFYSSRSFGEKLDMQQHTGDLCHICHLHHTMHIYHSNQCKVEDFVSNLDLDHCT
ncbi:hypothetical protein EPI10_002575 [Gossypium australe]|uniref:Uncharacterized protein n=1 Tax=Gossypium australe TaxID=47621 RepID=A0A5B6VEQ1_9ROSI|nr:hypothetical protein EPI10_002575 [Gossypium australe]